MARITPCLENGKIAMYVGGTDSIGSTELFVFRAIPGISDKDYIYYFMKQRYVREYATNSMTGASGRQRADIKFIRKMKCDFPELEEQEKIGAFLSLYDDLIENNNKRIKILEKMAEELYKEWFVRFRFPEYEDTEFEDGIPVGWHYEKLDKLVEIHYGKDHKGIDYGNIPVYGSGGIMRYCNRYLYNGESVLIPRKGSLNNVMYINAPFWSVDTLFYTKPIRNCIAKYLYFVLSSIDLESYNSGAALPSMTTNILYHMKIIVPTANSLALFDECVGKLFDEVVLLKKKNNKQRDLLLPRLMSGKLKVK